MVPAALRVRGDAGIRARAVAQQRVPVGRIGVGGGAAGQRFARRLAPQPQLVEAFLELSPRRNPLPERRISLRWRSTLERSRRVEPPCCQHTGLEVYAVRKDDGFCSFNLARDTR